MNGCTIKIDESLCIQCGECGRECGKAGTGAAGTRIDPCNPACTKCLHCYAVCPKGAIMIKTSAGIPITAGDGMPPIGYEELSGFLAFRRSTRRFLPKEIPEEILGLILAAALHVPSGGNRRSHEFTVIPRGPIRQELAEELKRIYRLRSMALNSPVLKRLLRPFVDPFTRAFLKDPEYGGRIRALLEKLEKGEDPVFYDAPVAVAVHTRALIPTPKEDSVLAGFAACLAAQSLGLGSCFVTLAQNAVNSSRACRKILGLAPEENVHAVILLGYPAVRFRRPVPRGPAPVRSCARRLQAVPGLEPAPMSLGGSEWPEDPPAVLYKKAPGSRAGLHVKAIRGKK